MNPERQKSPNELRADAVMESLRTGKHKTVPEAVVQILKNEGITHDPDVTRIMSEVGTILQKRKQYVDENQAWEDMHRDDMIRGATEAYWQRGGDPDDLIDDEENPSGDHYIIGGRH